MCGGNPKGILNDLQNVTAVLLLPVDHPLYKRVRSLAIEQRNNKRKNNQEVQKRKREQNNDLVPIRVPGGWQVHDDHDGPAIESSLMPKLKI